MQSADPTQLPAGTWVLDHAGSRIGFRVEGLSQARFQAHFDGALHPVRNRAVAAKRGEAVGPRWQAKFFA